MGASEKGCSSASAMRPLEAEKRGSPLVIAEKNQRVASEAQQKTAVALSFSGLRGAGRG